MIPLSTSMYLCGHTFYQFTCIRPCQFNYLFDGPNQPYFWKIANKFKGQPLPNDNHCTNNL